MVDRIGTTLGIAAGKVFFANVHPMNHLRGIPVGLEFDVDEPAEYLVDGRTLQGTKRTVEIPGQVECVLGQIGPAVVVIAFGVLVGAVLVD